MSKKREREEEESGGGRTKKKKSSSLSLSSLVWQGVQEDKVHLVSQVLKQARKQAILHSVLNAFDEKNDTNALILAAKHGHSQVLAALINAGAEINTKNRRNNDALNYAAQHNNITCCRLLFESGKVSDESRNSCLIPAAHFGCLEVVKLLLSYGAPVNYTNEKGTTALMRASQEGKLGVVQILLEGKAQCNQANEEGMTALMLAAQRGHARITSILLKYGALVDSQTRQNSTALLLAAKRGHIETIKILVAAEANIYLKDERNRTACHYAVRREHHHAAALLTTEYQIQSIREKLHIKRKNMLSHISVMYCNGYCQIKSIIKKKNLKYHSLLRSTLELPLPLVESIADMLPFPRLWDKQIEYLDYEVECNSNNAVLKSIKIMDEILLDSIFELSNCTSSRRETEGNCLVLLRDSSDFRRILQDSDCPLPHDLEDKLIGLANVQGILKMFSSITFGAEVADKVVEVARSLLEWCKNNRFSQVT